MIKKDKIKPKPQSQISSNSHRVEDTQLYEAKTEITQLKKQNYQLEVEKKQMETERNQELQANKSNWDLILEKLSREESKSLYKDVKLSDLQDSYDRLDTQFNKILEEAKIFDFPYQNNNYENILKGRKYELRVAQSFHDQGYKILEWTPDKGIERGMYVESNNNPDLVIEKNDHSIAIECKYRGAYFYMKKHNDEISWASIFSAEFYADFSQKRKLPVFLALGFKGSPEFPDNEYLIPLNTAMDISLDRNSDRKQDEKKQKVFRKSNITKFLIVDTTYHIKLENIGSYLD